MTDRPNPTKQSSDGELGGQLRIEWVVLIYATLLAWYLS